MVKGNTYLAVILALALLTIIPRLYSYNINQGYWWDEAVYLGLSKNIFLGDGYWINVPGQEAFRPPLFAILTSSVWLVFGFSESLVKILPPVFGMLAILITFLFARKLYGKETAIWAGLILATSHYFLFYGGKFLTETMFAFLSISAIYAFYLGIESKTTKGKLWLPLSGVLMALSFLTRYAGLIIGIVYILYPIVTRTNKKQWLLNSYYWLGLIIAFLILIPWFLFNLGAFDSPVGALFTGLGTVTSGWYLGGWSFYFTHWFELFGLIGLFAIPGITYLAVRWKRSDVLIFLVAIVSLLFFIMIPRKEARYLLHFFPIYTLMMALGVVEFKKWVRSKRGVYIIAIIFVLLNLIGGIQMLQMDVQAGSSLKEAGLWLSERAPEGTRIMSNNIPVLYYTSGREIVYFPEEQESLRDVIEGENISFLVIEKREPSYPEWVWVMEEWNKYPSGVFLGFNLENEFKENNETFVWVYSIGGLNE